MSHEIENMMYVGQTPWHKLGIQVTQAPSIEEAIKLAGLDWKVGLKPLFTGQGESVEAFATYRETDNRILGVVGPQYKPLQNADAFKFFNPFLQSGETSLETAGSLRNGQRVWILAKINREDSVIVKQSDDRVAKYLLLSNSHDGTLAIRVGFTPIRVVCNNTLSLAHNAGGSQLLRVKHTGNVNENLEKIQQIINVANERFEATADQYRLLASKQVNSADLEKYVKIVFSQANNNPEKATRSNVLNKIVPLFEHGRGNNMPGVAGTLWAAYNAVTEYIQYERGTNETNRLDSTWFGTGNALNKKALDTALELVAA